MAQFEKLQELWQGQSGPAVSALDAAVLTRSLRAYGRRQQWVNSAKVVAVASVLGWLLAQSLGSPLAIAGVIIIALAAATMLRRDWRNQQAISRLDFSAPSLGFVRGTIDRLMEQRDPFRRFYWPVLGTMVVGANLLLIGKHRGTAPPRIAMHIVQSVVPFVGYELGMWLRRRRFEAECRPLISQLAAMQAALEERFE